MLQLQHQLVKTRKLTARNTPNLHVLTRDTNNGPMITVTTTADFVHVSFIFNMYSSILYIIIRSFSLLKTFEIVLIIFNFVTFFYILAAKVRLVVNICPSFCPSLNCILQIQCYSSSCLSNTFFNIIALYAIFVPCHSHEV